MVAAQACCTILPWSRAQLIRDITHRCNCRRLYRLVVWPGRQRFKKGITCGILSPVASSTAVLAVCRQTAGTSGLGAWMKSSANISIASVKISALHSSCLWFIGKYLLEILIANLWLRKHSHWLVRFHSRFLLCNCYCVPASIEQCQIAIVGNNRWPIRPGHIVSGFAFVTSSIIACNSAPTECSGDICINQVSLVSR